MAIPNIFSVDGLYYKTFAQNLTINESIILSNGPASHQVLQLQSMIVSNVDGTNSADVTVILYKNGTGYKIVNTCPVPAKSSLVVISKDNQIYLEEGDYLSVVASEDYDLQAICSYQEIFDTDQAAYTSMISSNYNPGESDTIDITLNSRNIVDGTTVGYTVTGIDSNDITAGNLTGSFTINNNQASISFTFNADLTAEGPETITITLASSDSASNPTGSLALNLTLLDTSATLAANAWLVGGVYTQDFHKRSFTTMSNEVSYGSLSTTNSGGACGSTNYYKMICSCFTGVNTTNSDIKDLSTNANATTWGNTAFTHWNGMADGNQDYLMYYGGFNGSTNTRQQTKQSYASASSSQCGSGTVTGTRVGFCGSDYNDYIQAGAGDNNSSRTNATWRTSMSSCSVTSGPGLPSVMYVMQAAGNDTYNCVSGNFGNSPYNHLNQINRYQFSTNTQTNNWLGITGIDGGVNVSDRDDLCFHGGSASGWQKFSISSGGTVTYFGSTSVRSGTATRGPGV